MEIRLLDSVQELDAFVGRQPRSQFLQSWHWGEFQKAIGRDIVRLGVIENDTLIATALLVAHQLPLGQRYWYCPRGPIIETTLSPDDHVAAGKLIVAESMKLAAKAGVLFVRVEPPIEQSSKTVFDSMTDGIPQRSTHFVQPQDSHYLSVQKNSEELLNGMHQKTRYNIRLAEKKGVTIRIADSPNVIEDFWKINSQTTQRDGFKSHDKEYYQRLLETLAPAEQFMIFVAEREGNVLAVNLVAQFGDTMTYVHGASSDTDRNVMAPHLLQWKQIQFAQEQGLRYYDFGGVGSVIAGTEQRWAGISRFKKGFGGQSVSFVGAHDLIVRSGWYRLYTLIKRLR